MNDAHLHLIFNHFPILGTLIGLAILFAGIIIKNNAIKNVSYILFIVAAITAFISMSTGEGAEELVEEMPTVGKQIIHEHEELAEKLAIVLYVLGTVSIFGLVANIKKHHKAKLLSFIIAVVAFIGVVLAKSVGTSGGEIRHTEIRENALQSTPVKNEDTD